MIFSFERLGRVHENKFFFFENRVFLILDLYLYDIKIRTNISQNGIEKSVEKSQFSNIYIKNQKNELGWACIGPATRLDSAQLRGLG